MESASTKVAIREEDEQIKHEELAMKHVQKIMRAEATVRERYTDAQVKAMRK